MHNRNTQANRSIGTRLGNSSHWTIALMHFDPNQRAINIRVDYAVGCHFAVPGQAGEYLLHDTVTKTYGQRNVFQHECEVDARLPRVKPLNGKGSKSPCPGAASSPGSRRCAWRSCC